MKVLMYDNFLPGNSYTHELGKELGKLVDLHVVCRQSAKQTGKHSSNYSIAPMLYSGGGSSKTGAAFSYARGLIAACREIVTGGYDLLHVQCFNREQFEMWPIRAACSRADIPLVFTVHNVDPHEASDVGKDRRGKWYESCSALIAHNEATKSELLARYRPTAPVRVIPHGAYAGGHGGGSFEERGNRGCGVKHLLFFGMIREYKGVDILLSAVSMLPERERSRIKLVIAGNQHASQYDLDVQGMARDLGIESIVDARIGYVEEDEIGDLFGWCDYAVFPYREIYGSGALLMAYTYGKPVIASDLPSFAEETDGGRTGILFERGNPASLAEAIVRACNEEDSVREERRRHIRRLVAEKYNWERSANLTAEAYRRCLGRR